MTALTLFLALSLVLVLVNTQTGFAVFLNGEHVGKAKSLEEVTAVVTDAEKQLREILGRDYPLDSAISVSADLGAGDSNTESLKKAIIGGIEEVCQSYVLEVGGKTVGASADEKVLAGVLNDILKEYTTAQTTSAKFAEAVTVTSGYVSKDVTQNPAEIKALLEPFNTASPYRLTVECTQLRSHTEPVAYTVQKVDDSKTYQGSSTVRTKGEAGENLVTEETVYLNGYEQSSEVVRTERLKAPVTEVVAVGTAAKPKTASYGAYIWPTEGIITSRFGPRTGFGSANHQGIDIGGAYGENIVAADGGVVIKAEWYYGYGLLVQIRHDNGDITYYGHNSKLLVKEGDRVARGQVIAHMGQTGEANGVHCHFEIRRNGKPVNPLNLLP